MKGNMQNSQTGNRSGSQKTFLSCALPIMIKPGDQRRQILGIANGGGGGGVGPCCLLEPFVKLVVPVEEDLKPDSDCG